MPLAAEQLIGPPPNLHSRLVCVTPMNEQPVLAVLPGANERERLVLLMSATPGAAVELVQQSWSESTGWYTQTSLEMTGDQVALLRNSLGRVSGGNRFAAMAPAQDRTRGRAFAGAGKPVEAAPAVLSLCDFRRAESA